MRTVGRHPGITPPDIVRTETDPRIPGTPFYPMTHISGRIPSDVPRRHKRTFATGTSSALVSGRRGSPGKVHRNRTEGKLGMSRTTTTLSVGTRAQPPHTPDGSSQSGSLRHKLFSDVR